jgi:ABC-type glycerol-3-phosphate transport system substrate-binding protein
MKRIALVMSGVALLLASCSSSTKVTSSWKASNTGNVNYQKVLVLGIMNKDGDRAMKETMEDQLANELKSSGINAVPANTEFPPNTFNNVREKRALKMLQNKGYDAVMTIVLLDKSKENNYTPGNVMYEPYGMYYNHFWGYYRTVYARVYTPGYYTTNTNYFWESNLYDLNNNKLLYSVQSKSFDPSSIHSLGEEYAHQITKDMIKQGLLVKK